MFPYPALVWRFTQVCGFRASSKKAFKGFPDCPFRAVDDPYVHPDRAAAGAQTWVFGENSLV
jgi:hypothetical protein